MKNLTLPAVVRPWGRLSLYQKQVPGLSPGVYRRPGNRADNLVTFCLFLEKKAVSRPVVEYYLLSFLCLNFKNTPSAPCARTQFVFFTLRWSKGLYTYTPQRVNL